MRRFLTVLLSFYWIAFFSLAAWAGLLSGALPSVNGGILNMAGGFAPVIANSLIAVLFLWTALSAVLDGAESGQQTEEIARLACAGGVGLMFMSFLNGATMSSAMLPGPGETSVLLALLVSYVVIRIERRDAPQREDKLAVATPVSMARLNALGAAHGSLLDRIPMPRVTASVIPFDDMKGN